MKYNIKILSKQQCTLLSTRDLKKDYIIISINDTGYDTLIYKNSHIKSILKLWFDDIEFKIIDEPNLYLMSKYQVKQIKDFINRYKNIKNIIIHCTAGISRSAAIGCVLARYLNGDDNYLWASGKYMPNKYVYKLMCDGFNLKYSEELFKYKSKLRYEKDKTILKSYNDYGQTLDDMFCDVIVDKNSNS